MEEIGPVIGGVVLAWLASFVPSRPVRLIGIPLVCVAFGLFWSHMVGELAQSWGYAVLDAAQVLLAYSLIRWVAVRLALSRATRSGR